MNNVVISSICISLIFWQVCAQDNQTTKEEKDMQPLVESVAATPSLIPDMEAAEALKKLEVAKKEEELKATPSLTAQPDKDEVDEVDDEDEEDEDYDFDEDEEDEDWDEDDIDDDND